MDERLRQAFESTDYIFDAPGGELQLRVGRASTALHQLLVSTSHSSAACLTAWNPGGIQIDEHRNRRAQQELERELHASRLPCYPGRHVDPAGQWPTEISTLVLGLNLAEAHGIAARYGQMAFLWSDASGIPQLIETDSAAG